MKKKIWIPITIVVALLVVLLVALFFFIEKNDEQKFYAKVLEINDNSVLVEPVEGELERASSDKISFNITNLEKIEVAVGSIVQITYNGIIMESYPAQITARSWKIASDWNPDSVRDYKPVIYLYPEKET